MQTFANRKQHFQSFMEFSMIHPKNQGLKTIVVAWQHGIYLFCIKKQKAMLMMSSVKVLSN